jgi:hypothetical protein
MADPDFEVVYKRLLEELEDDRRDRDETQIQVFEEDPNLRTAVRNLWEKLTAKRSGL